MFTLNNKSVIKLSLKIPPHVKHVYTLPCNNIAGILEY